MDRQYSEVELGLKPRWFTGKEWTDGTAQRILRDEYFAAVEACNKGKRKPEPKPVRETAAIKPIDLSDIDNKGLSPIQMVQRMMRK